MTLKDMLLCAGFSLALPIGQALFKFAAVNNERLHGPLVVRLLTNVPLLCAFAWYALTALFWFYILTRVPLSLAYALHHRGLGPRAAGGLAGVQGSRSAGGSRRVT